MRIVVVIEPITRPRPAGARGAGAEPAGGAPGGEGAAAVAGASAGLCSVPRAGDTIRQMRSDLEIEQSVEKLRIQEEAARLGLGEEEILPHGRYIAKVPYSTLEARRRRPDGRLVLVTAMSP